jgi:hypothetical protein
MSFPSKIRPRIHPSEAQVVVDAVIATAMAAFVVVGAVIATAALVAWAGS